MKRSILIFSFLLLLVFCMAGCSQERQPQENTNTSRTTEQSTEENAE